MTILNRRQMLTFTMAAGAVSLDPGYAWGAAYPEKPVRMIIPIAAGGQTDVVARLLQNTIDKKKLLPQPIAIINNAAAGGSTGTRQVRDSEPDGYTVGMFHMGLLTAPSTTLTRRSSWSARSGARRSGWALWATAASRPSRTCSPKPKRSPIP
jgi:tripartite-type tricarboxylate transporter receptor subunit TctC